MQRLLVPFVLVLLVACANTSPDQDMALACSGYNSAGRVAVTFHADMTEPQKRVVDSAKLIIGPLCRDWSDGRVIASHDLVRAINEALASMLTVTRSFQP